MKLVLAALVSILVSHAAFAADPRPPVKVAKQDDSVQITITGPEAEALFDALDVEAQHTFSIVQTSTKKTDLVTCTQAILGDIKGRMSEPRFTCVISASIR